jgi:N-acetylmuramoyl-L-alanine amidase
MIVRMKHHLMVAVALCLGACATGLPIDGRYSAKSQDSRVQFVIVHFTTVDFPKSLKTLTEDEVSSHYLISERVNEVPAKIYQLVDESRRAFHAGASSWKGASMLNAASIGIEIVNLGYREEPSGRVWYPFQPEQIDLVVALLKKIVAEHGIKPDRILGHSDIAPGRKNDPGPKFPWKRLADEGLIIWPDAALVQRGLSVYSQQLPDIAWFQQKLIAHGFSVPTTGLLDPATRSALEAFQMKYRQSKFDGEPDAETAALLDALTQSK